MGRWGIGARVVAFLLPAYKTGRYFFVVLRWSMAYGFGWGVGLPV